MRASWIQTSVLETGQQNANRVDTLPNRDVRRTVPWVFRLTGMMLLAKLAVEVADALVAGWGAYNEWLWMTLLLVLPTIGLLCVIGLLLLRRGRALSSQTLGRLLAIIMVVNAMQIVARPIVLYLVSVQQQTGLLSAFLAGSIGGFSHLHARPPTGVVFMMIPAVLGAWISGKQRAWRWAVLGVVLSVFVILLLNHHNLAIPELIPYVAEDVALVLLTLFVGSLADHERAEQARLQQANLLLAEQSKVREQLATSCERLRMARELHDTVAHSLAGLVFQLDALETQMGDAPESAQQTLARAKDIARQGLSDARVAVTDLRKGIVDDFGLLNALQKHVETATAQGGVPITFEQINCGKAGVNTLNKASSDALFRIAQEAIYNASRHAHARQIRVKLVQEPVPASSQASLKLSVEDDGIGFDASTMQAGHYGLRGMRERAALVGARFRLDSRIGGGTIVSVVLPLKT
ncbi:MAG: sensor histidine kinase [Chloroflexi bacterium]|nr:sensor histidine kinase [Chloroflexota bacterium]